MSEGREWRLWIWYGHAGWTVTATDVEGGGMILFADVFDGDEVMEKVPDNHLEGSSRGR